MNITKRVFIIVLLFATTILAGCATIGSPIDYGIYPNNHEEIVKRWIGNTFYDPYSVRDLEIGFPKRYTGSAVPVNSYSYTRYYGYQIKVTLNAKNRVGGYAGKRAYYLLIRNGRIVVIE